MRSRLTFVGAVVAAMALVVGARLATPDAEVRAPQAAVRTHLAVSLSSVHRVSDPGGSTRVGLGLAVRVALIGAALVGWVLADRTRRTEPTPVPSLRLGRGPPPARPLPVG